MSAPAFDRVLPLIQERLDAFVAQRRAPGLAVGIVRDQELAWSAGYGYADLATRRKPDANTLFRVASITKTFTAAAILQLRDAGHLNLDDPLHRHIPEFAKVRVRAGTLDGVTLRRLLTHHSGLTTETPLPSWSAQQFPTREEVLAALPDTEIVIPQDSAFKYSNLAFGLLGEVVQRIAKRPYFDYLRTEILEPLGMNSSVFDLTPDLRPRFAVGYLPSLFTEALTPAPYASLQGVSACGQLHSSVHDLARWVSQQFRTGPADRGGAQVLRGNTIEESHRPQYVEPDWSTGYGMCWRGTRHGTRVYLGHGGGIHGFASYLLFSKPHRVGVICLANVWPHPGVLPLAAEIADLVIDGEIRQPAATTTSAAVTLPAAAPDAPETVPAHYERFLGMYEAMAGIYLIIAYRGGTLRLERTPLNDYLLHVPATLEPDGDGGTFIVRGGRAAGERLRLQRDHGGRWSFTLGGFDYHRISPIESDAPRTLPDHP